MALFESVSTLRCVLLYRMLLWLNQFLSALYSSIFYNIFNISDIRMNSPERKVAPKFVIVDKIISNIHSPDGSPPTGNHSMENSLKCYTFWTLYHRLNPLYLNIVRLFYFNMCPSGEMTLYIFFLWGRVSSTAIQLFYSYVHILNHLWHPFPNIWII